MPGALLLAAAISFYDFGSLDLVALGLAFGAHFVLGWIYLFLSLLFLPRMNSTASKDNPFSPHSKP